MYSSIGDWVGNVGGKLFGPGHINGSDDDSRISVRESEGVSYGLNQRLCVASITGIRDRLLAMPKGSWVVWALDETIWTSVSPTLRIQHDEKVTEYIEQLHFQGVNSEHLFVDFSSFADCKLIEKGILELISELKGKEIHVLALTSRLAGFLTPRQRQMGLSNQDITLLHLEKHRIKLSQIFPEGEIILAGAESKFPAIFKNGVAFCSNFEKGEIVEVLLNKAKELGVEVPPAMALIDDVDRHAESVQKVLKERSMPYLVVDYYGAEILDDYDHFDFEVLKVQLNKFYGGDFNQFAIVSEGFLDPLMRR